MSSQNRSWIRSLALFPGALLPLLPSTTCPACLTAFAGVVSAMGLGFLIHERVLAPLIALFLAINIASVAWSTRTHGHRWPLLATLMGSAAVVASRLIWHLHFLLYGGVALLIGASLFNLWLKRSRPEQLIQIHPAQNE